MVATCDDGADVWYAEDSFSDVPAGSVELDFKVEIGIEAVAIERRARTRSSGYVEPTKIRNLTRKKE